jgi:hypothetical protein
MGLRQRRRKVESSFKMRGRSRLRGNISRAPFPPKRYFYDRRAVTSLPDASPNQTPRRRAELPSSKMEEEKVVDGKTFQAYSMAVSITRLRTHVRMCGEKSGNKTHTGLQWDTSSSMLEMGVAVHTTNRTGNVESGRRGCRSSSM